MIMDPNGPECGCSQKGCLEMYASASNVARIAKENANKEGSNSSLAGQGMSCCMLYVVVHWVLKYSLKEDRDLIYVLIYI